MYVLPLVHAFVHVRSHAHAILLGSSLRWASCASLITCASPNVFRLVRSTVKPAEKMNYTHTSAALFVDVLATQSLGDRWIHIYIYVS